MTKARINARTKTMQTNHPAEELDHHEKELGGQRVVEDARGTGDSGLHWTTRARAKQ